MSKAAALADAARSIRGSVQVALACHVSPDGDALGSMLAMHHVLRHHGIASVASFSEPFVVAAHYRELPGLDLMVPPSKFPTTPDVMITFDCGSLARLGDLQGSAMAARELIVIDHHISNDRYGSINVIDDRAAASGVVVRELVRALGFSLDRDAAICLYAALVCDTGRFQYASTTAEVFELAHELVQFDIPIPTLSRTLFEEHRFAYLQLMASALQRAELVPEERFVSTIVTQDDLTKYGVTMDEVEGLIDVVRRAREAEVTAVLKEDSDGSVRVSLRSLGEVDVCAIAQALGGGGHKFAAGFTANRPSVQIVAELRAAVAAARNAV